MKRRIVLVVGLVAVGATWWFWSGDQKPWRVVEWDGMPTKVQFTPDSRSLVMSGRDVRLVDVTRSGSPSSERVLPESKDGAGPVWISPDGDTLVALRVQGRAHLDPVVSMTLGIWDLASGTVRATVTIPWESDPYRLDLSVGFADHGQVIRVSRFLRAGGLVVSQWEASNGRPLPDIRLPDARGTTGEFTEDGSALIHFVNDMATVTVHALDANQSLARFEVPVRPDTPNAFRAVSISRDGRIVATLATDHSAQIWDVAQHRLVVDTLPEQSPYPGGGMRQVEVAADGRSVVTVDYKGVVQVRETQRGSVHSTIQAQQGTGAAPEAALSPDGRWLVVADSPPRARTAWEQARRRVDPWLRKVGVAVPRNPTSGRADDPPRIRLFDGATGAAVAQWGDAPKIIDFVFRPDGRAVAIHGVVYEWEGPTVAQKIVTQLWDLPARP